MILQGANFKITKRFDQCILDYGPTARGCYKRDLFFFTSLNSIMQRPSKGKHSLCFSVLPDYGCVYLGFYAKKGLHGHSVCTESRWPSITCCLGKQSWAAWELHLGSKGCSNFSPQSRWLCRGAVAVSHSAVLALSPQERVLCAAQQLYLPAEAWLSKHRAEQQGRNCSQGTQPHWFQTLKCGTAHFSHQFYSRELAFPGTAANKSKHEICFGATAPRCGTRAMPSADVLI